MPRGALPAVILAGNQKDETSSRRLLRSRPETIDKPSTSQRIDAQMTANSSSRPTASHINLLDAQPDGSEEKNLTDIHMQASLSGRSANSDRSLSRHETTKRSTGSSLNVIPESKRHKRGQYHDDGDYEPPSSQQQRKTSKGRNGLSRSTARPSFSKNDSSFQDSLASTSQLLVEDAVVDFNKVARAVFLQSGGQYRSPTRTLISKEQTSQAQQNNEPYWRQTFSRTSTEALQAARRESIGDIDQASLSSSISREPERDHSWEPKPPKSSRYTAKRRTKRSPSSSLGSKLKATGITSRTPQAPARKNPSISVHSCSAEKVSSSDASISHARCRQAATFMTSPDVSSSEAEEEEGMVPVARRTRLGGRRKLPVRFITPELEDLYPADVWEGEEEEEEEGGLDETDTRIEDVLQPPEGEVWIYTAASEHAIALMAFDRHCRFAPPDFSKRFDNVYLRALEALNCAVDKWHKEWIQHGSQVTLFTSEPRVVVATDGKCKDVSLKGAVEHFNQRLRHLASEGIEVTVDYLNRDKNRRVVEFADGLEGVE